ncbi:MAG: hypothetical protein DI556_05910 [Rhodovulum sulfidophilum]|uniref:Uncharacterized protein n=1 Tax=Rhodovulum sulfidophilum TaxID=35806 RepID=A0A2W5NDR7_RHOSU|nr:MAG: hypothetical protein DI556_05910 [Rhodovulum sulfidophilum]
MNGDFAHDLFHALRRFPDQKERVARLAERSETFRDMCEELAAAERALAALTGESTDRRIECEGWIDRLLGEMSEALCRLDVLPLPPRRSR